VPGGLRRHDVAAGVDQLAVVAAHLLIVLVAAVLISANRKPSAAIAWLRAIIFLHWLERPRRERV
jgi:cardiolipin synthase